MFTVGDALTRIARQQGTKTALITEDFTLSFTELNEQANRIAWTLHDNGLQSGDRVALLLPNGWEMVACYFGIAKAGMMAVPLNVRWTASELEYAIQDAQVSVLIADPAFEPVLRDCQRVNCSIYYIEEHGKWQDDLNHASFDEPDFCVVDETDDWLIVYTSGTTGRPKGAVRNHLGTLLVALSLVMQFGITPQQVGFAMLPLFHVNSMLFVLLSVIIGSTCVVYTKRSVHPRDILRQMTLHRVNYTMLVPSLWTVLADAMASVDQSSLALEILLTSSAPFPASLRDRIMACLPHARLYDVYGATEYGAATVYQHTLHGVEGTVGYPVMGNDLRILDEQQSPVPTGVVGEVYVRGLTVIKGYWRNPMANAQAFTNDGYLTVGDMGYLSDDGKLFLVDRKQDLIVVAGENVYPSEVEDVLWEHPSVGLATVFGVPDALYGERVVAMVMPKANFVVSQDELSELCQRKLAPYKRPYRIAVVSQLPVGPAGKVVRRQARTLYLEQQAHPSEE
ncbi:MAG: class I adenylate-forming enzyme family protein [Firmicutes bacterium]|nr:class I adenylate-forming enzyme family protein [Bacillota bacterium]